MKRKVAYSSSKSHSL